MAVAASLNLMLTANAAQYETVMNKASRTAKATGASMSQAGGLATSVGRNMNAAFAAVGVGVGLNAIRQGTLGIIDAFESADLMSKRLGISYNSLVTLQKAAAENGSSVEVMNGALEKMTKLLGNAAFGEKSAADALDRLGLSFGQLETLAPEQQFARIMEAVSALPNEMMRTTAITDIFGRSAGELGNLLGMTSQDMAAFQDRLKGTGKLLSDEQIDKMREAADAVDKLSTAWDGFTTQMTVTFAPAIVKALSTISDAIEKQRTNQESFLNKAAYGWAMVADMISGDFETLRGNYGPANADTIGKVDDSWKRQASPAVEAMKAATKRAWQPPTAIEAGTNRDAIFSRQQSALNSRQNPVNKGIVLQQQQRDLLLRIARAVEVQPVELTG